MSRLRRPSGFGLYAAARTVSLLGDAMTQVTLTVAVLHAGLGAGGVGYALAAWLVPVALLVLFGGALADRFEPRRLMVSADAARTGIQAVFALTFALSAPTLWQIIALQAAGGAATAMFTPGSATMVPRLTPDVQRGNAALRIAEAVTTLAGPALGGVVLAFAGIPAGFGADAASFAISALCLLAISLPSDTAAADTRRTSTRSPTMWRSLAEGWQEFRSRPWLWRVIVLWASYGLLVFGPALPLTAVAVVAAHGTGGYAVITSAFGAGTLLGGALALRVRPARPLAAGSVAMAAFGAAPLVVAAGLPPWALAAGHLVAGAALAFWSVIWATAVQTGVPAAALSRVAAYDVAGSVVALPVGRALSGPAAEWAGVRPLLAASAACAVVISGLMLATPAIRGFRRAAAAPDGVGEERVLQEA